MLRQLRRALEEFHIKDLIKEYGGCQQCGWCCRCERLSIFSEDVEKLGQLLKPEHIENLDRISVTLHLPCPFLNDKNRCSVYNRRPEVCATYPFLFHYPGLFTIAQDCICGKKICNDIIRYCNAVGIKIAGDELKTAEMKFVDNFVKDKKLNSGDGYASNIVNIPFDMFKGFLIWRKKLSKR